MNRKKNIIKKYKGFIPEIAFLHLNDDIEMEMKKEIEMSKNEIKELKKFLNEDLNLSFI